MKMTEVYFKYILTYNFLVVFLTALQEVHFKHFATLLISDEDDRSTL